MASQPVEMPELDPFVAAGRCLPIHRSRPSAARSRSYGAGQPSRPAPWEATKLDIKFPSRALLLVLLLLILSFFMSYYLKLRRIKSIHETIVALFAGQSIRVCFGITPTGG
jgi:hypothetical protein